MTRCREFYEKLERDGNFCGMTDRAYNRAMRYWNEYRKAEEDRIDKNPGMQKKGTKGLLSLTEWFEQQKKTPESVVGTEKPIENDNEDKCEYDCPTCSNAKENVLDALSVLDHYGIPPELGDKVQKWIEEKYGK